MMRHSAETMTSMTCAVMRGLGGLALLSYAVASVAWADDSLSREAIMKQHQALAQQHEHHEDAGGDALDDLSDSGVSTAEPEALPSPAPSTSEGRGETTRNTASSHQGGSSDLVTTLLERVTALEGQVREMHGQMEQMSNQLHQDEATVNKQLGDMQFALENGHHAAAPPHAAESHAAPAVVGDAPSAASAAVVPHNGADALQAGRAALKAHNYKEAEEQARQAIKESKTGWSKTEAQFLLAQSLAGQKAYKNAALTYYDIYSRTPSSPRAPESLLGVSASMLALGNKAASCEALQRLHKEFPNASARVKASEKIFRERASCH
ncbi:tetratricopeptide repeat protein [Bombella saccharophila]|uniref:Tetratricopeptide repeat protein n=1 Tax=Bombella saccharophila TaxID=2967338 RepID=A0ABT3W9U7_9PROT|nr:tetratricopeptide repeat protein [Bombella saccharophila]MCX5613766.1 tetratricopeptide repeat protein [Bombella saccharophila]